MNHPIFIFLLSLVWIAVGVFIGRSSVKEWKKSEIDSLTRDRDFQKKQAEDWEDLADKWEQVNNGWSVVVNESAKYIQDLERTNAIQDQAVRQCMKFLEDSGLIVVKSDQALTEEQKKNLN